MLWCCNAEELQDLQLFNLETVLEKGKEGSHT